MFKFKMSLLFNNLKFRIALVVVAIAAIVVGIICIPKNKASQVSPDLKSTDIISRACTLMDKYYDANGFGVGHGSSKNVWGNGWSDEYITDGSYLYAQDNSQFVNLDCTGLIYYTLTSLGCKTTGFGYNNPVPVDPPHWYKEKDIAVKGTYPDVTLNSKLTLTYNGKTSDIKVLKAGDNKLPYYMCVDGSTIPDGSIVISRGTLYGNGYSDHGWIYIGNLNETDPKKVAKILVQDYGVDPKYIINGDINGDFTIKQYYNKASKTNVDCIQQTDPTCTHWRIECTADSARFGVYINNGNPNIGTEVVNPLTGKIKKVGPIYAYQLASVPVQPTGDYSIEVVKVKQDGTTVITSSEATFNVNGTDKTTTNGVLSVISGQKIESTEQHDIYTISETIAPQGFNKYQGTITLDVYFKKDGNKYVIDTEKTIANSNPQIATQFMKISDDCKKITLYVPNEEQGKYNMVLKKVDPDGNIIESSEAEFLIDNNESKETKQTTKGILNIATDKQITDVNVEDHYTIKETKAPNGYVLYDGLIDVKVGFKNDNGYKLDPNKVVVTGAQYEVNNSTITITVPNSKVGSYRIILLKVDKDNTPIKTPAVFKINGEEKTTKNDGTIVVASVDNCDNTEVTHYLIEETQAPKNYVLSNKKLDLSVQMTKTDKGYELLNQNIILKVDGNDNNNADNIKIYGSNIWIYVPNEKEPFDMALRKFITKINGKDVEVSRKPVINEQSVKVLEQTGTAAYHHPKNSLLVKVGDEVEYTLRVYNEGKILGYAKQITDYLPEGLSFVRLSEGNSDEYTTSSEEGSKVVVINYSGNKEISSLRDFIGKEVKVTSDYYQEVKLICKVNDVESLNFTNRAEITNYGYSETDSNGNVIWYDAKEIGNSDQDSIQNTIKDQLNLDTWADNAEPFTYTDESGKVVKIDDYYPGAQDDDDFEVVHIVSEPQIHKGIKSVDNQDSGYAYFDIKSEKTYSEEALSSVLHNWVIESTIVKGINNFKLYEIVDNVDTSKLDFAGLDRVKVSLVNKEGNVEKVLVNDTDYKATYKDGKLVVTIISNEPEFKGQFLNSENSLAGYKVRVEFNTTFKVGKDGKLVVLADKIQNAENQATLNYNNGHEDKTIKSEIPEVHTGAVSVFKYDDANRNGKYDQGEKALVGAKFKIAYDAEGTNFVKDLNGNDVVAVSNEKGIATFTGLAFGGDAKNNESNKNNDGTYSYNWEKASTNYYVVEVEAPKGFTLLEEKVKVTVSKDSSECIDLTDKMVCIANVRKYFDLSLRKFITEVNGVKPETSREPQVDISKLAKFEATTATYNHPKDVVDVNTTDVVTYTIRVYNEGDYDEFAKEIMDDIPDGLEFLPENETNKEYKWIMRKEVSEEEAKKAKKVFVRDGKKYIETKDAKEADVIVSTYLSKENGDDNLIKAFDGKTLDYKDVKVAFKVVEPTTSDRVLVNYAQVTEHSDASENTNIVDRDSTPNKWIQGDDDQDTEKVRVRYFDLALLKYVSKAIVYENGKKNVVETGHTGYENPEPVVKVDLKKTSLSNVTVKFQYTIKITNEGEIEGYAKEISDYIPQGLKFVADDNKNWKEVDGKIVTDALANTLLKPGESAEVTVILTWINGENNLGLKVNTAEISEDYNEWGTPDIDSTPNNKVPGEDDIDDAPVILAVRTGINNTFFAIAAVSLVIVVAGIVVIKKKVLVK